MPSLSPSLTHRKTTRALSYDNAVNALAQTVASQFRVPITALFARKRGPRPIAQARMVLIYLGHVVLQRSLTHLANTFKRDRTTMAHACRVIEDRRDDPGFDACLSRLESYITATTGTRA